MNGFPNWFFSLGPNSAVGSGSLLALIEQQVEYAVQAGMKMQRERLKSIEIKKEAVHDYDQYIEVSSACHMHMLCRILSAIRIALFPYGKRLDVRVTNMCKLTDTVFSRPSTARNVVPGTRWARKKGV